MGFGATFPTVGISVTGTSKSVVFPVGQRSAQLANSSTTLTIYAQFGIDSATAVIPTADNGAAGSMCYAIPPMQICVVDVPKGANYVAAIGSGAGPTLFYITPGMKNS